MTFSDNPEGDAMNVEVAVDTATTTETLACGKRFIQRADIEGALGKKLRLHGIMQQPDPTLRTGTIV